jgi:hypothetical protein
VGAVSNTFAFFLNFMIAYGMKRVFDWYPKFYHNIICWMGIYTVLDPFITLFLDCCFSNWEWGDYFVFYNFFVGKSKGETSQNGAIGVYLTFFIFIAIVIFNGYVFYHYMVFKYMDGRILDLFRRLSGEYNLFFLPRDNEVSLRYL